MIFLANFGDRKLLLPEIDIQKTIRTFIKAVNSEIKTGQASERSFYPAIKTLIESCREKIKAQVESTGDSKGTPDFQIDRSTNTIGYIEAKDITISIEDIQNSYQPFDEEGIFSTYQQKLKQDHNTAQFAKYLNKYNNLIYVRIIF